MSHQFKPGDLALIVKAHHPENIGKVVELIRFDDGELIDHLPYADTYTENPDRLRCWLVLGEITVTRVAGEGLGLRTNTTAAFLERHLMPLRGDFAPEQQKAKEAEPCA
ncbi:hypothetical protein F477_03627 [Pseudomonas sp. URIL14HWK12:I3]|uniref:hypothetical protein n=1 Tax=Pseudomonas TaxID=286 RepID=UPI000DAD73CC|nr:MULTISPECIES: hypothetical protein [unclassified Pseudomonas]MCP3791580.1 hypothetical protein [Pseudomonas sp. N2-11]PZW52781.1 hypothetical protein F478_02576 [Pseudomonas sp. URIL14HWK12:I2]PZW53526.1 hypothetical protein F477_03627 [Pseudomonas sp. URIL14HWK12:I3]